MKKHIYIFVLLLALTLTPSKYPWNPWTSSTSYLYFSFTNIYIHSSHHVHNLCQSEKNSYEHQCSSIYLNLQQTIHIWPWRRKSHIYIFVWCLLWTLTPTLIFFYLVCVQFPVTFTTLIHVNKCKLKLLFQDWALFFPRITCLSKYDQPKPDFS